MRQKDIVLLAYPFTNLREKKIRPALVVSNNNFNKSADLIMIPLTTVLKDEPHSLLITQNDLHVGSLVKTSMVRVDKIFTVEKKLIIKKIATLNDALFAKIKKQMLEVF